MKLVFTDAYTIHILMFSVMDSGVILKQHFCVVTHQWHLVYRYYKVQVTELLSKSSAPFICRKFFYALTSCLFSVLILRLANVMQGTGQKDMHARCLLMC
jgi:hypothetical protein